MTLLVLGKASALAGAVVAAGYLVFGLYFVGNLSADLPRQRVIGSGVSALAGVALMVAGLALERACRVPPTDGDSGSDDH